MRDYLIIAEGFQTVTRQASMADAIAHVHGLSVRPLVATEHEHGVTFKADKPRARKVLFALRPLG